MAEFFLSPGSYFAIFLVMMLTGAGLPIPEEVPIIAAGIASAHGNMHPWVAFACCLSGALIGDCIMYYIGYHFGRGVLKDHRWWARFLTPEREARIEEKFRKHGLGVFFCRALSRRFAIAGLYYGRNFAGFLPPFSVHRPDLRHRRGGNVFQPYLFFRERDYELGQAWGIRIDECRGDNGVGGGHLSLAAASEKEEARPWGEREVCGIEECLKALPMLKTVGNEWT